MLIEVRVVAIRGGVGGGLSADWAGHRKYYGVWKMFYIWVVVT